MVRSFSVVVVHVVSEKKREGERDGSSMISVSRSISNVMRDSGSACHR